tara:strand:- start:639 stop:1994 length:1356 start_codon:yes stop_codon:yes gene_type:complete
VVIVRGGGLYLPPGDERIPGLRNLLRVRNAAHARHVSGQARGTIPQYAEAPPEWAYATRAIPAGHKWAGGLIVPRNAPVDVRPTVDRSSDGDPIPARLLPKLRPYQAEALAAWGDADDGTIIAPCGAGKTTLGLAAIAATGRRALILVHTKDLARQWEDRVAEQLAIPGRVGRVWDGQNSDGQIVIATIQTLIRWPWAALYAWGKRFGLVIMDEAHHAPAETFSAVLGALPARRRLGLTATPGREDGLGDFTFWHMGPKCYEVDQAALVRAGAVLLPSLQLVPTHWQPVDPGASWAAQITELTQDGRRNEILIAAARAELAEGRQVLVLSDRVGHCRKLATELGGESITGKLSARARAAILGRARAGLVRLVAATSLADEGLDLPGLDTVILATPTKALGKLQQRIGRVMRPAPGKARPRVIDLRDGWGPLLGQARRRDRLYRELGISQLA